MRAGGGDRWSRPTSVLALLTCLAALGAFATIGCGQPEVGGIEVFPRHFDLRPGETIHYMPLEHTGDGELHFIFPAEAIWESDVRPYPAPMVLLSSLWENRASDSERYDAIVVPFLDRLFTEYPVLDYPLDAPSPELGILIDGWNVEVQVGESFERTYRQAEAARTIRMEFRGP